MKKSITLISFLIAMVAGWAGAQITVTNAVFPAAGDSLKTASDLDPQGITVTGPGGPFTWDYSGLNADARQASYFQPAANGANAAQYPGADLVVIDEFVGETYFDVTATSVNVLGISGSGFAGGFPIQANLRYSPPLQEQHAPLTFPNVFNANSSLALAFSTDQLPSEILDSLGVPSGLLDSIRIRFTIARNDFIDAFGTMSIPGGTYNVLRQKRTDYTDTRIDIHTILGWQDITDLLGQFGGFGRDTTISYQFISGTEKALIAAVTMDSTGLVPASVDFKDNGAASAVWDLTGPRVDVVVSPNPAADVATFRLANVLPGQYTIHLFDATGHPVQAQRLTSDREAIPLARLGNGMYVYRMTDQQGRVVAAGRLMKMTP